MSGEISIPEDQLVAAMVREKRKNPNFRRDRQLVDHVDRDGYDTLLGIDIELTARQNLKRKGTFTWYDMCCGEFKAGKEFMSRFGNTPGVRAVGIDINTTSQSKYSGRFEMQKGNVVTAPLPQDIDLITCVTGLYLVDRYMGPEALNTAIERWYNSLAVGGMLALMRELPLYQQRNNQPSLLHDLETKLGSAVEVDEMRHLRGAQGNIHITKQSSKPLILARSFVN